MKLPKKVYELSITKLKNYLRTHHPQYNTKKNQVIINQLIQQEVNRNKIFTQKIKKSALIQLAIIELKRESYSLKDIKEGFSMVFSQAVKILNKAEKKGQWEDLKRYIKKHN